MRYFDYVSEKFMKNESKVDLPKRATQNSAGYDFYSPINVVIEPQTMQMIWTDVKACMNKNDVLILCVTSGMGKYGIMVANTLGIIDADYFENEGNDGNIGFRLYNFSKEPYIIKKGDKIGQGVFTNFLCVDNEKDVLTKRVGGYGSTVKK